MHHLLFGACTTVRGAWCSTVVHPRNVLLANDSQSVDGRWHVRWTLGRPDPWSCVHQWCTRMHQWLLSLPPGAVLVVHPTYILPITGRDLRSPCAPAHAPVHWMDRSSLVLMDLSHMRFGRFTMKRTVVYRRGIHPHRCTVPRFCLAEMVWLNAVAESMSLRGQTTRRLC